jgi:His/Glu/Gln/Arg/opine family amino acid ABC transporter permease subunit
VLPLLLQGAGLTLLLTVSALAIGIPMGLLLALGCVTQTGPLRGLITAYVEAVRGTPLLMQIYVIYFVLPSAGLRVGALEAGIAALGLNAAAYVSEIFRAGVQSIDTGQMEAARALGMDTLRAMRWVILPQTFRRVLPPLTNETVALLKDSSLVSVVALSELMRVGKELATGAGSPLTIYLLVALIYLAMTLPLTGLVRRLEARLRPGARRPRPAAAGPA